MNGELAHVIALATHGSTWLRSDADETPLSLAANTTFKFVRSIEFAVGGRSTSSVEGWLGELRAAEQSRLLFASLLQACVAAINCPLDG